MTSNQILDWLNERIGFETYQHLEDRSLIRIKPYFSHFLSEIKQKGIRVITVGGTNGKGETCYHMAEQLKHQKISFALFISPHVHCLSERFYMSPQPVTLQELWESFQEESELPLSYFEFLFYHFLKLALKRSISVLILEVGVGGRLDVVNLVDAHVMAITSISRDHQELLGSKLGDILKEKLGIARSGYPLYTALESHYLKTCVAQAQKEIQFKWHDVTSKNHYSLTNKEMAKALLTELKFSWSEELVPLHDFPGRSERLKIDHQNFLLVAPHNTGGLRHWITSNLQKKENIDLIVVAFSKRSWSDIKHMMKQWLYFRLHFSQKFSLMFTEFEHVKAFHPNAKEQKEIEKIIQSSGEGVSWTKEFSQVTQSIRQKKDIIISGSYYFVGYMSHALQQKN
jgi:dihydrofolate synthase/folylpolyglutamate synthase